MRKYNIASDTQPLSAKQDISKLSTTIIVAVHNRLCHAADLIKQCFSSHGHNSAVLLLLQQLLLLPVVESGTLARMKIHSAISKALKKVFLFIITSFKQHYDSPNLILTRL